MTAESIPWIFILPLYVVSISMIYIGIKKNPEEPDAPKLEIVTDFKSPSGPEDLLIFGMSLLIVLLVISGIKLT